MSSLTQLMDKMPLSWARRWCEPGEMGCACLGCANHAGGLLAAGFTKEQWSEYLKSIPTTVDAATNVGPHSGAAGVDLGAESTAAHPIDDGSVK